MSSQIAILYLISLLRLTAVYLFVDLQNFELPLLSDLMHRHFFCSDPAQSRISADTQIYNLRHRVIAVFYSIHTAHLNYVFYSITKIGWLVKLLSNIVQLYLKSCVNFKVLIKLSLPGIITIQSNKNYKSLVKYIARMIQESGIRLLFFSAGIPLNKQIKKNKSLRGYCQGIPIQCSHRDFLLNQQNGADDKYECGTNLKMLSRRDRQSYCLYRRRHSRRPTNTTAKLPNLSGEPRTPYLFSKRKGAPKETKLTKVRYQTSYRKRG